MTAIATTQPASRPGTLRAVGDNEQPTFALNARGEPLHTSDNVVRALTTSAEWAENIRLSELDGETKLMRPPEWDADIRPADMAETYPRSLSESDVARLAIWLDRRHRIRPAKSDLYDALGVVAERYRYHPIRDYLAGLDWDGVPRIERWLTTYLGVEDTAVARLAGPWWLAQAVRRVMEPGTKADYVVVLEGAQGAGKSTSLETLCPDREWFMDSHVDLSGSREGPIGLRGKWICEFGELASMERVSPEQLKSFLSRRTDRYRPLFGRLSIDVPRQSVFAGTTNEAEYLRDDTGGRRFWPVVVGQVDLDRIARDRDQLWAEAAYWYYDAQRTWPSREEQDAVFGPAQEARRIENPHRESIVRWLMKSPLLWTNGVTATEVCVEALGLKPGDLRPGKGSAWSNVATVMRSLGWRRNDSSKRYFYAPGCGPSRDDLQREFAVGGTDATRGDR